MINILLSHDLFEQSFQLIDMLATIKVGQETRILHKVSTLEHILAKTLPSPLVGAAEHQIAIASLDRLIRRRNAMAPTGGLGYLALGKVGCGLPGKPRQAAFGNGDIDMLAFAGVLLMNIGSKD